MFFLGFDKHSHKENLLFITSDTLDISFSLEIGKEKNLFLLNDF